MKKYLIIISLLVFGFIACKKNTFKATERTNSSGFALVKLALFNAPTIAFPVTAFNNNVRVSPSITAPYPFPGNGTNTNGGTATADYLAVGAGVNTFSFYTTVAGTPNTLAKNFETAQTLVANKKYTIYMSDTGSTASAILASDDAAIPDSGFARIRFVNLIPNVAALDFYKGSVKVQSNIAYNSFTDYFDVVYSATDSLSVRVAGSAPGFALNALAYRVLATNNRRVYSIVARGYSGQTGNKLPNVSSILNQ